MSGLLSTPQLPSGQRILVSGEVVDVHDASTDDGAWVRATIQTSTGGRIVVVGATMLPLRVGCIVQLAGVRREHVVHGSHLRIIECYGVTLPTTADGVARYLSGAGIHGCGVASAKRIVAVLGADCLAQLQRNPSLVEAVFPGRRGRQLSLAMARWASREGADAAARDLMAQLLSHGISTSLSRRVLDFFRAPQVAEIVLRRRPYRLLDVPDIGWKRADGIARKLGVRADDPDRLIAAMTASLDAALRDGHSALYSAELLHRARALVGSDVSERALRMSLDAAEEQGVLVVDADRCYRPDVLESEWRVARAIARLVASSRPLTAEEREKVAPIVDGCSHRAVAEARHVLSSRQREAVWLALESGAAVLSGRPGSGKTTTLRTYIECCKALGREVMVVAPTGKAASRATEVTGVRAQTIHRLLGVAPGVRAPRQVSARVLVVDETSMCSLDTVAWLLDNLDLRRCSVLFCGDADQLPSVEHGAVLHDLAACGAVPGVHLTHVHRQQAGSRIIENAHALLDGRPLVLADDDSDFRFVSVEDAAAQAGAGRWPIEQEVAYQHLRSRLRALILADGAAVLTGLQVLAPTRKGPLGVVALNALLQQELNPDGMQGPSIGGNAIARVGDRVIQVRNDYGACDEGLMNGEQGTVIEVDPTRSSLVVEFGPNRRLRLAGVQLLNLRLAWAITVHRSQGSEWPRVILVYHDSHTVMLDTRLLYTAITRAKREFTLIGTRSAIATTETRRGEAAIRRTTGLADHLALALRANACIPIAHGALNGAA